MQIDNKLPLNSSYSPTLSKKQNLLSASLNNDENSNNQFSEKTIYRSSQKFPQLKENQKSYSRCSTAASYLNNRNGFEDDELLQSASRAQTSRQRNSRRKQSINNHSNNQISSDSVDWSNLGIKIEDWFNGAKTPEQKIVYKFLKDIKDEDRDDDGASSVFTSVSNAHHHSINDKAQSLEDILDNLKKYRTKFNRSSKAAGSQHNHRRSNSKSRANTSLPKLRNQNQNSGGDFLSNSLIEDYNQDDLNSQQIFESSTWRVMRHLKSADIRNKYPLPKANPDFHFRNATIFHTCGRPPKSTFLLHPDWV